MYPGMDVRRTEVRRNGDWVVVLLKEVRKGETFRMFESTGEPVSMGVDDTRSEYVAASDAYLPGIFDHADGVWSIDVDHPHPEQYDGIM